MGGMPPGLDGKNSFRGPPVPRGTLCSMIEQYNFVTTNNTRYVKYVHINYTIIITPQNVEPTLHKTPVLLTLVEATTHIIYIHS